MIMVLLSQRRFQSKRLILILAAVVAILIHSISDFNLLIPANALLFTVIAGTIRDPDKQKPLKLDAD